MGADAPGAVPRRPGGGAGGLLLLQPPPRQGLHGGHPQVDGRLLHAGVHLHQEGAARADGVGQLADDHGDDDDGGGAGELDNRAVGGLAQVVEGHDVAQAQHRAGDDVGGHHQHVQGAAGPAPAADDDIGHEYAQHQDKEDSHGGEHEGVADIGGQAAAQLLIVLQGEALGKDEVGVVGLDKGAEDDDDLGQEGHQTDHGHRQSHEKPLPAVVLGDFGGTQGGHGVVLPGHPPLLQEQDDQGDDHDDHGDGAGQVGVAAGLAEILVKDQHRQGAEVAAGQDARGAEVGQGSHEHHQGARSDGGHDHGDGDGEQAAQLARAQVLRALLHRAVNGAHGPGYIEVDVGEELEGEHRADAPHAVDAGHLEAQQVGEPLGHHAGVAEQDDPAVRAQKGRAHEGEDDDDMPEGLARDVKAGHQVGHGHADENAGDGGHQADLQAVTQGLIVIFFGEEAVKIVKGEALLLAGEEAVDHQGGEGVDQKQQKHRENQDFYPEPEILVEGLAVLALQHESTSSVSFR